MRLIDADELKKYAIPCEIHNGALTDLCVPLYQIDNVPTVEWKDIEFMGYVNGKQITKIKPSKIEGHWIEHNFKTCGGLGDWDYKCSICEKVYCGKHNYCPNCGARMKRH